MFVFSRFYVEFLRIVFSNKFICILKVVKLVSMAQGLLGPLMPRKSFLCKFGIDFAFYNLARCLAWLGSCLCPSLNIFGLKTGSLGWRKDTNRIYIFTTRHSGGCARRDRSDIYNYPARQSIRSSGTFQNLFLRTPFCMKAASNPSCAYSASSENFSTFPHLQPPPLKPPGGPP